MLPDLFFDWPHADLIPMPRAWRDGIVTPQLSRAKADSPFALGLRLGPTLWGCSGFDPWFACAAALGG